MTVTVRVHPHAGQREVHQSPARLKVITAGRRWGKTRLGVMECIDCAVHGGTAWWIAPSYKVAKVGWKPLARISRSITGADVRLGDLEVRYPGGGSVAVRSADNEGGLRGEGLDYLVIDEAAFVRESAWVEELRPALSDRLGRAMFISTPNGHNWFHGLFLRGLSGQDGWQSFQFPTSGNPYIATSEIEAARLDMPEIVFQQEYMAQFVDLQGAVFRRLQESATVDVLESPIPGHRYIAGVDVASAVDYTVVCVLDAQSKELVYMDRYNRVDYNVLEDRLAALHQHWKLMTMAIETNSIGQPVIDRLVLRGLPIVPFTTTSGSKQMIITALQSAFEHGEIKIINNPILMGELLSFEGKRNLSGSFSYSAPAGMHDDCVMSLAIAWDAISAGSVFAGSRY